MTLEARHLTFSYTGSKPIIDDVSLVVQTGERLAITGPSGTGKSTLCRLLAGYAMPSSGEVVVDGVDVREMPSGKPRSVQLIWQHPEQAFDPRRRMERQLCPWERGTGLRGRVLLDDAAREMLDRVHIRQTWLSRLPHELSGGELMRFAIARALLADPAYLICDEMTAMLDALTQADMWRVVLDWAEASNKGLIVVSHSESLLSRIATRSWDVRRAR